MRLIRLVASVIKILLASLLVAVAAVAGPAAPAPSLSIDAALDAYARGLFDEAVAGLDSASLTPQSFVAALDNWIDRGDAASRARRVRIATAFALEADWAATRDRALAVSLFQFSGDDLTNRTGADATRPLAFAKSAFPIVTWACERRSALQDHAADDRWWWLASVAALEDASAWHSLLGGEKPEQLLRSVPRASGTFKELTEGHISHARAFVSNEPRLELADAIVRSVTVIGYDVRPSPYGRGDILGAPVRNPKKLLQAEQPLLDLAAHGASFDGEIDVRLGYLELRREQWQSAMMYLDRARPAVREPFLKAVIGYLTGWLHDRAGRHVDAIAAYREALAITPRMRNVSTLLAADLFLGNERDEAYRTLIASYDGQPPPFDLVSLLIQGDARLMPEYCRHMREALR